MNSYPALPQHDLELNVWLEVQELLGNFGVNSALCTADGTYLSHMLSVDDDSAMFCPGMKECPCNSNTNDILDGLAYRQLTCPLGYDVAAVPVSLRQFGQATMLCCLKGLTKSCRNTEKTNDSHNRDNISVIGNFMTVLMAILANRTQDCVKKQSEIEALSSSLAQSYEEMSFLHRISNGMKVNRQPQALLSDLCDDLEHVVNAQKIVMLWLDGQDSNNTPKAVMSPGGPELDDSTTALIWERTKEQMADGGQGVLIDSSIDGPFRYPWPENIKSIVSVPIKRNDNIIGVLTAINKIDRADFDSTDTKLLASVVNEMAVYLDNSRLYRDLQELLVGSLRALTSSIDAKDPYTCGHSERVALIAKRLATQMSLSASEIETIYLTGLLHDVGKIGVREAVLCKPGKLVDDEFRQIREHPQIGARILSGIRQMAQVSHGVLAHHERYDGLGYPLGLCGHDIPLCGRIIMLADSFDAMISDRTYRKALPIIAAQVEVRRFGGTQFDPTVAQAFLSLDISDIVDQLNHIKSHQHLADTSQAPVLN